MTKREMFRDLDKVWKDLQDKNRVWRFYNPLDGKGKHISILNRGGSKNGQAACEEIDYVAEWLIEGEHFKDLRESLEAHPVGEIGRDDYKVHHAEAVVSFESNRYEEQIADAIYNASRFGYADRVSKLNIGKVIDYQVPLSVKGQNNAGLGDIDLLAKYKNELMLIELKRPTSDESLLKCVLEAYSYAKLINRDKFCDSYFKDTGIRRPLISICPMFFNGVYRTDKNGREYKCRIGMEYDRYRDGKYPALKSLVEEIEKDLKSDVKFRSIPVAGFGIEPILIAK